MTYQDIPFSVTEGLLAGTILIAIGLSILYTGVTWKTLLKPLFAAFFLRILATLYQRFIGYLPQGGSDAVSFERRAWEWANSGCGNLGEHLNLGASYVHSWLIGNIYACTDRAPLVFQMVNVGLGLLTIYFIARIAEKLWDREAAIRAAWISAIFPMFIINAAVPLREAWFTAFILLSILWLVHWVQTRKLAFLAGSAIMMLPAAVIHGSAIFALGAMGLVIVGWGMREVVRGSLTGQVRAGVLVGSLMLGGSVAVGLLAFGDARFSSIGEIGAVLERAESLDERAASARGGSAYPGYLVPSSDIQMLALTPVRIVYTLFGPPPWEVRAPNHLFGMFDGLIYLAMALLLFRYRDVWSKRRDFRILVVVFAIIAVVLAWGVNNFGTGMRHRAKFVGILIALAAGLIGRQNWRKAQTTKLRQKPL